VRRRDAELCNGGFERGLFVGRIDHANEAGRGGGDLDDLPGDALLLRLDMPKNMEHFGAFAGDVN
jgi:hypothetical protein